ncbi:MAG: SGNH/GDSL hydrolase family protein [Opitutaceae bacterium]|jgi:lysophospholipase L1-like esterase
MKAALYALLLTSMCIAGITAQTTPSVTAPTEQKSDASKARPAWELEWAYFSKYHEANARLAAPKSGEKRVVFFGDSITEQWVAVDASFFAGKPYVGRGIGGQTTSQMLVRFRPDVIELKPAIVIILAGTNDIAGNGGPTTLEAIEDNLQSMAELARINGIRVILASLLPAFDYPWHRGLQPADKISELNRWIKGYCKENRLVYLDYYSAMVDGKRGLRLDLSNDGVHPTLPGFAVMAPLAEKAIQESFLIPQTEWPRKTLPSAATSDITTKIGS